MAIYFLDSSAVVKRYVPEKGSAWVVGITDPASRNLLYSPASRARKWSRQSRVVRGEARSRRSILLLPSEPFAGIFHQAIL